jgi:hypothetical protein
MNRMSLSTLHSRALCLAIIILAGSLSIAITVDILTTLRLAWFTNCTFVFEWLPGRLKCRYLESCPYVHFTVSLVSRWWQFYLDRYHFGTPSPAVLPLRLHRRTGRIGLVLVSEAFGQHLRYTGVKIFCVQPKRE